MMNQVNRITLLVGLAFGQAAALQAADPVESDYYQIDAIPMPDGVVVETSGIEMMPDGKLAVCGRRGNVYVLSDPFGPPDKIQWTLYAEGLHEPLNLAFTKGWLYCTQRGELTRMKDIDGDDRADVFETVNDGWGITGDYHEYAFGTRPDPNGDMWIVLCLTGSFSSQIDYRGWCVRVTREGELIPTSSGIRSPGGIGLNHLGEAFYADNQGPWNGSSSLKPLSHRSFQGHPGGFRWYDTVAAKASMGKRPIEPKTNSRWVAERAKIPELVPSAIVFPHGILGNSTAGFAYDSNGKFGPFKNQLLVCDQTFSVVNRAFLEKVNGVYQGAAFSFLKGFGSGNISAYMHPNGTLFVGGTDRGWGARGGKRFALDRVMWKGGVPFEIHEMRAKPDGFELTFTHEVDALSAGDVASYSMSAYTYIYRSDYGSPAVDKTALKITGIEVTSPKTVRVIVDSLVHGHVHELNAKGVRSGKGLPILHPVGYYTLNEIPPGELN
ncbi:MAG: hypothetical protein VX392_00320 [Verrucomicrobiota bacterium]|nr:hypothetical protein [Verrucomicrobiota bacterium]